MRKTIRAITTKEISEPQILCPLASNQNIQLGINNLPYPIIVLSSSLEILDLNYAALMLYNWTRTEALKKNIFELCAKTAAQPPLPFSVYRNLDLNKIPKNWKTTQLQINRVLHILNWSINSIIAQNEPALLLTAQDNPILNINHNSLELDNIIKESLYGLIREVLQFFKKIKITGDTNTTLQKNVNATLKDLMPLLPGEVYWKDRNLIYRNCNEYFSKAYGLLSPKDLIGKTAHFLSKTMHEYWDDAIPQSWENTSEQVMLTGKPLLYHPEPPFKFYGTSEIAQSYANEVPLINVYGDIIGVMGVSIYKNDQNSLNHLQKVYGNISKQTTKNNQAEQRLSILTAREQECLALIAKGKTAKMAGRELNLSSRTVETYLEHAKTKLGCFSRDGLIEIFWQGQNTNS
jgi:DNA-binding CsgD family transcriptional regulator/PAS domain-containing protein